jgi:hypothetical protein
MDSLEKTLLSLLAIATLLGVYWGFTDPAFFTNRYMMEDGEIEYLTVILLLASCVVVLYRWVRLRKSRSVYFSLVSWFIFIVFFFVAGEELSWGQRIIGIETTEYFRQNNAQEELNLHNLVVSGVKINKLIFGLILTTAILIYMVLVPILFHRVKSVNSLLDHWYVPIPRLRHTVSYLTLTLVILIIPASKNWELLEFGSVLIFFLIIWKPFNQHLFNTQGK